MKGVSRAHILAPQSKQRQATGWSLEESEGSERAGVTEFFFFTKHGLLSKFGEYRHEEECL